MALADAGLVLAEGHVQLPVQTIFNPPVLTHRPGEAATGQIAAQDIVSDFSHMLSITQSVVDRDTNRLEIVPAVRVGQIAGYLTKEIGPILFATMGDHQRLMTTNRNPSKVVLQVIEKECPDSFQQGWLVSFDGQAVIALGLDNLFGDLGLATHRVDGDQTPLDFQHFQQLGNRCDLVAFSIDHGLLQADMIDRGPGADHMDGGLRTGLIVDSTEGLAIDRDDLPVGDFLEGGDPTQQCLFKLRGLDRSQNRVEPVMRRNPRGKVEELGKPLTLCPGVFDDCHEVVRADNHGANRYEENILQGIYRLATTGAGRIIKVA